MAGNRYYATSVQEVFESYEWLMREKLTELDHMARQIRLDLQALRIADRESQPMIQKFFADLWEQVAETEERKIQAGRKVKSGCGLLALTQAQKQA